MSQPVLLIVIPLLLAFLSISLKKLSTTLLSVAAIFNVVFSFFIQNGDYYIGGFKPPFGINLHVDTYAWYAVIAINILFLLSLVVGKTYVKKHSTVLLVILASINGLILTGDLFNLFVFLEIASIGAYILVSMNKKYIHTFNYLVMGTVGSTLYLLGVVFLYMMYGTLNMAQIHSMIGSQGMSTYLPIILIFAGLAVETKLLPFNSWVKGILGESNTLTGVMIASVYSGTMLVVFGRLFTDVFVLSDSTIMTLTIVAVITIMAGEFAAFNSTKLKEILLYSSIAQSGMVVVLFVNGLVRPAVLVILGNVVAKMILFAIAGLLSENADSDNVDKLQGIFSKHKILGIGFTTAVMSLIGLPLFFGLFVKLNALLNLFEIGNYWVPAIILLAALVEGAYFIRVLVKLWNPGDEGVVSTKGAATSVEVSTSIRTSIIVVVLSALLVVAGILPDYVIDGASDAANSLSENQKVSTLTIEGGVEK